MKPRRSAERPHRAPSRDGERAGERLIAIFGVGIVLFNPLVIGIFDRGPAVTIVGMPLLYFYLFAVWSLLIALLAWALAAKDESRVDAPGDAERAAPDRDGSGT